MKLELYICGKLNYSMVKSRMLFTLLTLWLFAIAAPSVITLIDVDQPVVVSNLNEEEQQEQGKKSVDQKKVVHNGLSGFSFMSKLGSSNSYDYYLADNLDTTLEIILPPPEHS